MMIKIALGLFGVALVCLISADVLNQLYLRPLATLVIQLGDSLLLTSFVLLCLLLFKLMAQSTWQQVTDYFSKQQRVQRQLLFQLLKKEQLQRLFQSKKKQLAYFNAFKRNRLLAKDNRQQTRLLAKSLAKQLHGLKPQLTPAQFTAYQQQLNQAKQQQAITQLIALQQAISTIL